KGSVLYVGIRADEESRVGIYGDEIQSDFPLRRWEWGINEVHAYLDNALINIPSRTDCATCFYQRLGEWWNLWKNHNAEFQKGVDVENKFSHTFRSPQRDTWPASLAELAIEFQAGRIPRG